MGLGSNKEKWDIKYPLILQDLVTRLSDHIYT